MKVPSTFGTEPPPDKDLVLMAAATMDELGRFGDALGTQPVFDREAEGLVGRRQMKRDSL